MNRCSNPYKEGIELGRRNPMTPQEKILYHQIHPLKLCTDICAEVVSLYLFWKRKLIAGFVVLLVPPIIASTLIIKWVDLEAYKQSAFGRYLRTYMTPPSGSSAPTRDNRHAPGCMVSSTRAHSSWLHDRLARLAAGNSLAKKDRRTRGSGNQNPPVERII